LFDLGTINVLLYILMLQAYINELENKVSRLEEENGRLKKRKVGFIFSSLGLN